MRWEALFADLEAQLAAADPDAALAPERERAEVARVVLTDRLRAHRGTAVVVRRSSGRSAGDLVEAGPDWLLLADGPAQVLVPLAAVVAVSGLSRAVAAPAGAVERRLGLAWALRALARERTPVSLDVPGHTLTGTIDRVGADHLDLAEHPWGEARRTARVREVLAVPLSALLAVRSTR